MELQKKINLAKEFIDPYKTKFFSWYKKSNKNKNIARGGAVLLLLLLVKSFVGGPSDQKSSGFQSGKNIKGIQCSQMDQDVSSGNIMYVDMKKGDYYYYDQNRKGLVRDYLVNTGNISFKTKFDKKNRNLWVWQSFTGNSLTSQITFNKSSMLAVYSAKDNWGSQNDTTLQCRIVEPPSTKIFNTYP